MEEAGLGDAVMCAVAAHILPRGKKLQQLRAEDPALKDVADSQLTDREAADRVAKRQTQGQLALEGPSTALEGPEAALDEPFPIR